MIMNYNSANAPCNRMKFGQSSKAAFKAKTVSDSERGTTPEKIRRALGIRRAKEKLDQKTNARKDAEIARDRCYDADVNKYNYMTMNDDTCEDAEKKYKELCAVVEDAKIAERQAREELWTAKYDTMTNRELQAALVKIEDEDEKAYVIELQRNRVITARKEELEGLSAVSDPESEYYDPDFLGKSAYQSTAVTDGSLGEMNTGYADIDYEYINGNPDISELIVGMDRNYYQITDKEKETYNGLYDHDQQNGLNKAKRYLELLQEDLNRRHKDEKFLEYDGKTLKEIFYAFLSTVSEYGNDVNIGYLLPEDYIPDTSTKMLRDEIFEDIGDAGGAIKFEGRSIPQIIFNKAEDSTYNFLTEVSGPLSPLAVRGKAYREMINRGYTPKQAEAYANYIMIKDGAAEVLSDLVGEGAGWLWKKAFTDEGMRLLGKLLDKTDWLGLRNKIQSEIQTAGENYALGKVTGEDKPDAEALQTAAKSAVTAKAMDKIFNRMKADPEEVSLDLRKSLLDGLKDPACREGIRRFGGFTPESLEEITARLESVGNQDEIGGTYVGDAIFWENGAVMSRKYLQQMVDEAIRDRDKEIDDPVAKAIYEKYMPR